MFIHPILAIVFTNMVGRVDIVIAALRGVKRRGSSTADICRSDFIGKEEIEVDLRIVDWVSTDYFI